MLEVIICLKKNLNFKVNGMKDINFTNIFLFLLLWVKVLIKINFAILLALLFKYLKKYSIDLKKIKNWEKIFYLLFNKFEVIQTLIRNFV